MPPKRKRTDEVSTEAAPSTRATRSSTRNPQSAASTSKSTAKKEKEMSGDQPETDESPPAKKTKASTKTADAATKTKRASAAKKSAASSSRPAEKSSAAKSKADDDIITQKKVIPEASTPTTVNEPPPILAKVQPPSSRHSLNEPYSSTRAQALFKQYEDSDEPNTIGADGFARLCNDANIAMEGATPLILAWQMGTKEMMKITADEWRKGTESLKISNLPALALAASDLEDVLVFNKAVPEKKAKKDVYDKSAYWKYCENKKASFNKLYMFCFTLVKPEQSKNIDMETATALWSVLLTPKYPVMGEVVSFITDNPARYKAANKDLWSMMLEFCETVNPNLSDYESDGAWPTLLDNFVAWKKDSAANGSSAT